MAIRRAPGVDRWYIIISRGRKTPPLYVPFTGSETEARAFERQARGIRPDASSRIVDLVAPYLEWYQVNRLPRSYGELNDTMKRLLPHFGTIPAAYLGSHHLEAYKSARLRDTWQGRATSKITINRELKHLMALLRWSAARGTIPAVTVRPEYFPAAHCQAQEKPVTALSPDEIGSFVNALTGPTKLIFIVMLWTGIRKKEACRLRAGDVDLSRGVFRLRGKGGKTSNEPIPASLVPTLKAALEGKKPEDWLCPNPHTGEPYTDLRTPLETACRRAGITKRFHPHACRHTYATLMDEQGASIVEIQARLRHADIGTTRRYIRRLGRAAAADYVGVSMSTMPDLSLPERKRKVKKPRT